MPPQIASSDSDSDPLCKYCTSLFNFDRKLSNRDSLDSRQREYRTWDQFEESAPHCVLCYQATNLRSNRPNTVFSSRLWGQTYRVQNSLDVSFFYDSLDPNDLLRNKCLTAYESKSGPRQYLPRGEKSDTEPCLDHLARCLGECLSQHDECTPGDRTDWLPTRLLDVYPTEDKEDTIRLVDRETIGLVENTGTNKQYLTLSHVWGNEGGPTLKLTQANYPRMRECIKVSSLPFCFRDAVLLARRLQKRYLWIDSLCIIQDSKSDWSTEASNMGKVFRNSTCTIAATQSRSSDDPMIVKYDTQSIQPVWITLKDGDHIRNINLNLDWIGIVKNRGPLFDRGWVIQEMWLSPRMIYMCEYPFWECSRGVSPNVWSRTKPKHGGAVDYLNSRTNINAAFQRDTAEKCWYSLVEEYCATNLTYPSDKLVAIGGLAKMFTPNGINEQYFAGLWGGACLTRGLLWRRARFPFAEYSRPAEYRAPSWSWASVDGVIFFPDLLWSVRITYNLVSINISPVTDDEFGQIKAAELIIRGFLFEIPSHITRERSDYSCEYFDEISLDVGCDVLTKKSYFLPLTSGENRKYIEGLILQPHGPQSPDEKYQKYTRIGIAGSFIGPRAVAPRKPNEWSQMPWPEEREQVIVIV